jgi:hypothetical protein
MLRVIISALAMLSLVACFAIFPGLTPFAAARAGETHREACNIVQVAFMAVINSQDLAYPKDMGVSSHSIGRLETFVSSYLARMGLGNDELSDLISQQDKYSIEYFAPVCDWRGRPQTVMDGHDRMRIEFSNPIFSSDSKLAIIEVSFRAMALSASYEERILIGRHGVSIAGSVSIQGNSGASA